MTAPLDTEGPAAPPRSNGELVFTEPWQSRAFGIAVALHEAGAFAWPRFQASLIERIAAWQAMPGDQPWNYYRHWLGALEDVLAGSGTVLPGEVTERAHRLADRPAGHDHPAGHGHGH
ncbi:nitrile hydratase accessory protein [Planotetraspora kaengkrachanensis]|uniref:Nitrile hydratase beta subunit-like N-terminal domain-containing protein n=1 Tax=Planotetraspora kaengkrachanensis TaxID=575193 RepID=A0A8J3V9Q5_9ACTN|nr:nitrile hydratase accessory protein [Planotetraspora kaengkrachanensis]GIG82872.1 hypothetical protein Pka01_59990 [Planotetraspora kaengkrachanensis]